MPRPVSVAVIGAGRWGRKLVFEYLSAECSKGDVKLAAVCDSSPSALLFCKEKFSVKDELLTRRVEDVMGDRKISAVHIAAPNPTHYPLARMALEAGKDVLVEKPMTLTSREAYDLVDLAASQKLVLHVGHIFRFNSALRKAREILDRGAVGRIFYGRIQWTDSCQYPDRDIVFDLGPHPVDVLHQLLGAWPIQVSGLARAYRNSKNHEEIAYSLAEYGEGVFAHVELSWLHPGKIREATIVGSEAALVIDCLRQRAVLHTPGGSTEVPVQPNNTIEAEIRWFVDCVSRRRVDLESGLIGARTVEVLEAMHKSIWERPMPIAQPIEHDRTATMVGILQSIGDGLNRNAFTYRSGLSSTQIDRILETMLGLGFLEAARSAEGTSYAITDKGLRFLREYGVIERVLEDQSSKSHQEVVSDQR